LVAWHMLKVHAEGNAAIALHYTAEAEATTAAAAAAAHLVLVEGVLGEPCCQQQHHLRDQRLVLQTTHHTAGSTSITQQNVIRVLCAVPERLAAYELCYSCRCWAAAACRQLLLTQPSPQRCWAARSAVKAHAAALLLLLLLLPHTFVKTQRGATASPSTHSTSCCTSLSWMGCCALISTSAAACSAQRQCCCWSAQVYIVLAFHDQHSSDQQWNSS
jgi:hypothetical protein